MYFFSENTHNVSQNCIPNIPHQECLARGLLENKRLLAQVPGTEKNASLAHAQGRRGTKKACGGCVSGADETSLCFEHMVLITEVLENSVA